MLLTLDNLANRSQYINAKNTFEELLRWVAPGRRAGRRLRHARVYLGAAAAEGWLLRADCRASSSGDPPHTPGSCGPAPTAMLHIYCHHCACPPRPALPGWAPFPL